MGQVQDLGNLSGPVVLFGGPYSNKEALEALLDRYKEEQATFISTGDVVAYCADGQACIDLIQKENIHVVAGNCEKELAQNSAQCGCGFEEGSACDILSDGWYPHALKSISDASKLWMGNRPDALIFEHGGQRYGVLHGGVTDIAKFLWSVSQDIEFMKEMEAFQQAYREVDTFISGHSGIAFERSISGKQWVNAGALGLPQNDGDTRTSFVVIKGGRLTVERLDYDFERTASRMEDVGLTQGYDEALRSGFWPSEDVLPMALRN